MSANLEWQNTITGLNFGRVAQPEVKYPPLTQINNPTYWSGQSWRLAATPLLLFFLIPIVALLANTTLACLLSRLLILISFLVLFIVKRFTLGRQEGQL